MMMKFENLVLILTPIALIFAISYISIEDDTVSSSQSSRDSSISNNSASDTEEYDALLATYDDIQQQEEAAFQEKIEEKWGEYQSSNQKQWLSYTENENVRRSVDYETGDIKVELLLTADTMVQKNVKKLLESETRKLLSSTEADAYQADQVAKNTEARLPKNNDLIQWGSPDATPLFNLTEIPALSFNFSGFVKVSRNTRTRVSTRIKKSKIKGKVIVQAKLKLDKHILHKTSQYAKTLTQMAKNQKISPALIYAIIETESNFNPMAKSHVPAYGLMQIVPKTAGRDATRHIWGKAKLLSPSYLYSSINNIQIGAAYLHVLYYKYLRKIKNPQSRVYCAIAAYNTGATNVARAFIKQKNFNRAARHINKLTSDQVYKRLIRRLPFRQTRKYVKKVTKAMNNYWKLQQQNVI